MSAILRAIVDHHIWANDTLYAFCEGLTSDQLALTVPGAFGPVHKTLVHIAEAEQLYLSRMPETGVTMNDAADPLPVVAELRAALRETGEAWRRVIARWPDDVAFTFCERGGPEERASVSFSLVQALDHGAEHRNHVRTTVSTFGIVPPELDGWLWDEQRRE
jgi:uncharacterized damage-inducible protein DinB